MVSQRRTSAAATLGAALGALALCTAASSPQNTPPPTGGVQAPEPSAAPPASPGSEGGGTPALDSPPAPRLAQSQPSQEEPPQAPDEEPPVGDEPPPVGDEPPPQQEQEFQIDVPPERQPPPRAPAAPNLVPTAGLRPAAGRLAQTGVDPRLPAAGGTFLIGLGLALFGMTLPRRV
jgi:hypothetical protein